MRAGEPRTRDRPMNDRSTTSIWHKSAGVPSYPKLARDIRVDACIIGAGIAGLSVAYNLAKAGKSVAVLDDGPIGGGESGNTTAHLASAMDDGIAVLEEVHGQEKARKIVESHHAAINWIERTAKLENIDCDFSRLDGWLFLGGSDDVSVLQKELAAAKRCGLSGAELLDRAPIANVETGPAIRFPEQGQFHVLKYLSGLCRAIGENGGDIFCDTKVESIEGGSPCMVRTSDKRLITADAVIVCTNGSISDMYKTHATQAPMRSYAVAFVVPRGSVTPALFWDTADPYHYVRLQPIDAAGVAPTKGDVLMDALIVGGEDHRTGKADDGDVRWQHLIEWARARWPQAQEVLARWSGQVLEPNDSIAFIGRNPDGAQNVYMASGDSGQGMTHGTIAGTLISDIILGRKNELEAIYDPRRVTVGVRAAEEFVSNNVDVAVSMVKDWLNPLSPGEDDIPRGHGRVVRKGMHRVAAYRDENGTLHEKSAVCTHLKCIVAWNSTEKSWDCPCHGSRFDAYGKVLNGPAVEDLGDAPA